MDSHVRREVGIYRKNARMVESKYQSSDFSDGSAENSLPEKNEMVALTLGAHTVVLGDAGSEHEH